MFFIESGFSLPPADFEKVPQLIPCLVFPICIPAQILIMSPIPPFVNIILFWFRKLLGKILLSSKLASNPLECLSWQRATYVCVCTPSCYLGLFQTPVSFFCFWYSKCFLFLIICSKQYSFFLSFNALQPCANLSL